LLSTKRVEFHTAAIAEFAQKVDRAAVKHLAQIEEAFVRRQIGIDNLSSAATLRVRLATTGEGSGALTPNPSFSDISRPVSRVL